MDLCIQGDAAAIEELMHQYQPRVYHLALSILEDPLEADEATQDAFVAILRTLGSYRGEAALTTWLYTITVNICRDNLRKRRSRERLTQALHALWPFGRDALSTPEETIIANQSQAAVWQAVDDLGEKHRLPIILRYYHGISIPEIAKILGINEGTVHSRLSIARDRLRANLHPDRVTKEVKP